MDRMLLWRDHILNIRFNKPDLDPEIRLTPDHVFVMVTRHLKGGVAQISKTVAWNEIVLGKLDIVRWTLDKCVEEIMLEERKTELKVVK